MPTISTSGAPYTAGRAASDVTSVVSMLMAMQGQEEREKDRRMDVMLPLLLKMEHDTKLTAQGIMADVYKSGMTYYRDKGDKLETERTTLVDNLSTKWSQSFENIESAKVSGIDTDVESVMEDSFKSGLENSGVDTIEEALGELEKNKNFFKGNFENLSKEIKNIKQIDANLRDLEAQASPFYDEAVKLSSVIFPGQTPGQKALITTQELAPIVSKINELRGEGQELTEVEERALIPIFKRAGAESLLFEKEASAIDASAAVAKASKIELESRSYSLNETKKQAAIEGINYYAQQLLPHITEGQLSDFESVLKKSGIADIKRNLFFSKIAKYQTGKAYEKAAVARDWADYIGLLYYESQPEIDGRVNTYYKKGSLDELGIWQSIGAAPKDVDDLEKIFKFSTELESAYDWRFWDAEGVVAPSSGIEELVDKIEENVSGDLNQSSDLSTDDFMGYIRAEIEEESEKAEDTPPPLTEPEGIVEEHAAEVEKIPNTVEDIMNITDYADLDFSLVGNYIGSTYLSTLMSTKARGDEKAGIFGGAIGKGAPLFKGAKETQEELNYGKAIMLAEKFEEALDVPITQSGIMNLSPLTDDQRHEIWDNASKEAEDILHKMKYTLGMSMEQLDTILGHRTVMSNWDIVDDRDYYADPLKVRHKFDKRKQSPEEIFVDDAVKEENEDMFAPDTSDNIFDYMTEDDLRLAWDNLSAEEKKYWTTSGGSGELSEEEQYKAWRAYKINDFKNRVGMGKIDTTLLTRIEG